MAAVLINTNETGSFFAAQHTNGGQAVDLISTQVDPTQPQVDGLVPVTDPILPDQLVVERLSHMDPSIYDLRPTSHLMRLITALVGAAGVGGLRKQQLVSRLATSLPGTHFLDLDGFWGALFNVGRSSDEAMPPNSDGSAFDPYTDATDEDTWDQIAGADGTYRSRISQFARAVNTGATYFGLIAAAEAILGVEVEILEAWTLADARPTGSGATVLAGNTYLAVRSTYPTYGSMDGLAWSTMEGGIQLSGQSPLGNRGEVILRPKRSISQEEKWELALALQQLIPAGVLLTIYEAGISNQQPITPSSLHADSENWSIASVVTEHPGVVSPGNDIYPNQSATQGARPAFSQYAGESWSYNSRISSVQAYSMTDGAIDPTGLNDYQIITFLDGTSHAYVPSEGLMTAHQALASRAATDGVLVAYPYSAARSA